jgi:hypothetical protein
VNFSILRKARNLPFLIVLAIPTQRVATQSPSPRHPPVIAFSQTPAVEGGTLKIDFAQGEFDLPCAEFVQRIRSAAYAVAVYYGRFPVARARVLVVPVAGTHGVLQGTTWGDDSGFQAFLRLRIGQSKSRDELASDWVITHELVHTALPSLPDDQHWLEEGIASYVEPIARVTVAGLLADFDVSHQPEQGSAPVGAAPGVSDVKPAIAWARLSIGHANHHVGPDLRSRELVCLVRRASRPSVRKTRRSARGNLHYAETHDEPSKVSRTSALSGWIVTNGEGRG